MQTEPSKADPPKRKRRWFQFSLRTLLIFSTICAVASAWIGSKIEQMRRQREAVAVIESHKGHVYYCEVGNVGNQPDYCGTVESVDCRADGDSVAALLELPDLSDVQLVGPDVTDSVLAELNGLHRLRRLSLIASTETDVGWRALGQFRQLREMLLCADRQVTDSTLECIGGFCNLESIWLCNDDITDVGLMSLKNLPTLGFLDIRGTKATTDGVAELKRVLPNLRVCGP
jgi:hypothetical protein